MADSSESSSRHSIEDEKERTRPERIHSNNGEFDDIVNLPYRTLTSEANMGEYVTEQPSGLQPVVTNKTGKSERYELVTFTPGDKENPKNWSKAYKWYCTLIVAVTCFAVAFDSAVVTAGIEGPMREFGVSEEVSLLTVTLFVVGFGVGPMAFAPLSEIVGRRKIYAITLLIAVVFIIPCAGKYSSPRMRWFGC